MAKITTKKHTQIVYKPPPGVNCAVRDDPLDYTVPCPICEKRSLDVSVIPKQLIEIRYKCPHCRNIVQTPLVAKTETEVFYLSIQ